MHVLCHIPGLFWGKSNANINNIISVMTTLGQIGIVMYMIMLMCLVLAE